jgi:hypothetical protein
MLHRTEAGALLAHQAEPLPLSDFIAYLPANSYVFLPTREPWPATSVNARVLPVLVGTDENGKAKYQSASQWLSANQAAEQMTWAPGEMDLVHDKVIIDGRWLDKPGCTVLNRYRPPIISPGDPEEAKPWLEHCHRIYPDAAGHIINCFAHRVQKPEEKINHGLVLAGPQGIGKDTALEPVKYAVGNWNFLEVSPAQLTGQFNPYIKCVVLRVSEARDQGDFDRYSFYEHRKTLMAAPPDVLLCDEKHTRPYSVLNVCFVVITTNHKTDGLYLPADDRRHFVAWSDATKEDFGEDYWTRLYGWYQRGGLSHVAAYLADLDISEFDPKAPPPQTKAFWDIVDANRAPEDAEIADVLDTLGRPNAITKDMISNVADPTLATWLRDAKNGRKIPHRMEAAGYERERNEGQKDGRWKVGKNNRTIYVRRDLSTRDRAAAVAKFIQVQEVRDVRD